MTTRLWTIGALTLMLVLLAGGFVLGAQPFLAAAAAADAERASVEQQNVIHQASIAQLATENENLAAIQSEYKKLSQSIPSSTDSSAFIKGLDTLAANAGVQISGITVGAPTAYTVPASAQAPEPTTTEGEPAPESTEPPAPVIPVGYVPVTSPLITAENFVGVQVGVNVRGSYEAVLSFLDGLQTGSRLFLVTGFTSSVDANGDSSAVIAQIDGQIYVLKSN